MGRVLLSLDARQLQHVFLNCLWLKLELSDTFARLPRLKRRTKLHFARTLIHSGRTNYLNFTVLGQNVVSCSPCATGCVRQFREWFGQCSWPTDILKGNCHAWAAHAIKWSLFCQVLWPLFVHGICSFFCSDLFRRQRPVICGRFRLASMPPWIKHEIIFQDFIPFADLTERKHKRKILCTKTLEHYGPFSFYWKLN